MHSIKEALTNIDQTIVWANARNSQVACFATFLHGVLRQTYRLIERGKFENGARMEQYCALLAQKYVEAFQHWASGNSAPNAWNMAFELAHTQKLSFLQNLLLGLSVHINLDQGIAAAQIRPGDTIFGLKKDFNQFQEILARQYLAAQDAIGKIWPVYASFYWPYRNDEHSIVFFSLREARSYAWKNATMLALAPSPAIREEIVRNIDGQVMLLNHKISMPGGLWFRFWLWVMRRQERGTNTGKAAILLETLQHST